MKIQFEVPDDDSKATREAVDHMQTGLEIQKVNAICFWLIRMAASTNAESAKITQQNVTHLGKELGDWEITIKKV